MEEGYVLVIGAAGIDIKGRPAVAVEWEVPNLGQVRNSVGGVARNIAENLARLEVPTILLTALGRDSAGRRVRRISEQAGINCEYVRVLSEGRTGAFMALLYPDGQLHTAISDFEVIQHIDPEYLHQHEALIKDAALIVIDATLTEEALATVFELAKHHQVRIVADPTNPYLATRLCPYLSQLYMIIPNASETAVMCGIQDSTDRESALTAVRDLVTMGVDIAVVTLGKEGLAYADNSGAGFLRAINTHVVDSTGAGDAFTGAAIFGILNGVPVDEAMRLGNTAASLTLESRYTVLPNLSQELLYSKLTV